MASSNKSRVAESHDDILGLISTGIAGGNQWNVKGINTSLFPLQFLRNNSTDFFCVNIQSPHWRKQGANIDSIHIHYLLDAAYTGNQTILFDIYWAWVIPNTILPNTVATWNQLLAQSFVLSTGNLPQYQTGILSLATNIAPPSPEGYGIGLLIRLVRGNGTYTGELGILNTDIHVIKDRDGSVNEFTD